MEDYKYYLFKDEKYGDIYTNYKSIYNKKDKRANDEILSKSFFKMTFLCLALTFISTICFALFEEELIMWIGLVFAGLVLLFVNLFLIYFFKVENNKVEEDFKLTQEYYEQVEKYKQDKKDKKVQEIYNIIRQYHEEELKNKEQEEKEKEKEREKEYIKLDKDMIVSVLNNMESVVTKNIMTILKTLITAQKKNKTEKEVELKPEIKEEPTKRTRSKRSNKDAK